MSLSFVSILDLADALVAFANAEEMCTQRLYQWGAEHCLGGLFSEAESCEPSEVSDTDILAVYVEG